MSDTDREAGKFQEKPEETKGLTPHDAPILATKFPDTFELMVNKGYLDCVSNTSAVAVMAPKKIVPDEMGQRFRIHKLKQLVYDAKEDRLDKLSSVLSAVHSAGSAVFILLDNQPAKSCTDIYLGVRTEDSSTVAIDEADEILSKALRGNFPGLSLSSKIVNEDAIKILDDFRKGENQCVAAITGVPSFKREGIDATNFTQGLEKLVEAMGNERYTALILSEPVSREELTVIEQGYQEIYTQISSSNTASMTISEQDGITIGKSIAENFSTGITAGISETNSVTETKMGSVTKSKSSGWQIGLGGSGGMSSGTSNTFNIGASYIGSIGGSRTWSKALNGLLSISGSYSRQTGEAITEGESEAIQKGDTKNSGISIGLSKQSTDSESESKSYGVAYQVEMQNKRINETLKILDEQLERIRTGKNFGMWNWGAYIIAHNSSTAKIGANIFNGIFRGESSGVERSGVSIWTKGRDDEHKKREAYDNIISSLSYLQHPIFALSDIAPVRTTSLLNTRELAVGMSLPQKSLPGLPVLTAVEFGRSISSKIGVNKNRSIDLGSVSHLGTISDGNLVSLDIDSLASHVFVAGSTGSGKSNAVYNLINKLSEKTVHYLVVEPAKGEYKKVFGGRNRVKTFGTNPDFGEVLRINPFSFPESIHVVEHIDRLIEILNVAWPMYAAMPAILKDAVEKTYEKMGWDLTTSKNRYEKRVFPDFHDLLDVLPQTIQASEYDREVKNNYAGALLTRIRSMTNGYFRLIFQKNELDVKTLFDNDCLIDFSRVGASETTALLMGVVFLRLHEYRMSTAGNADSKLKHVTVLEEAHRLLKNTTVGTGPEGVNLQGKSVEMMTNAIAEMRTYGEGFVIVDQAPALLDPAVIRNTNTKIVLRLPDYQDRLLVGKSENLKDDQIDELARLPLGCAAVYQSNWQEAVLCQIGKYEGKPSSKGSRSRKNSQTIDSRSEAEKILLNIILSKYRNLDAKASLKNHDEFVVKASDWDMLSQYYPWYADQLKGQVPLGTITRILHDHFMRAQMPNLKNPTREEWMSRLISRLLTNTSIGTLNDAGKELAVQLVFDYLSQTTPCLEDRLFFQRQKDNAKSWWR